MLPHRKHLVLYGIGLIVAIVGKVCGPPRGLIGNAKPNMNSYSEPSLTRNGSEATEALRHCPFTACR
jgi:hypothetical protein